MKNLHRVDFCMSELFLDTYVNIFFGKIGATYMYMYIANVIREPYNVNIKAILKSWNLIWLHLIMYTYVYCNMHVHICQDE